MSKPSVADSASILRFAHISDTHFGPSRSFEYKGRRTYEYAQKLVEVLNSVPCKFDFIVHTGDVANDPSSAAYEQAAEVFAAIKVPMYFATGNHDNSRDIRHHLKFGPCEMLPHDETILSYAFSLKGFRFVAFDARGPNSIDPQGIFSPSQLEFLRAEIQGSKQPLVFFGHYPILPFYSPWFDANMRIQNGFELHNMLVGARDRVRGVFFGHVHQSLQATRDGVTYTSVPSSFYQFGSWPGDEEPSLDPSYLPGFNIVTLTPTDTLVRQHTFPIA